MNDLPKFIFSSSAALDFVLSKGTSSLDSEYAASKATLVELDSIWTQFGLPLLNYLVTSMGFPFKRKEVDIIFSKHISQTVFHPVIVKLDLENLDQRTLKNAFVFTLQAAVHIWGHDNWSQKVQEKIDTFDFPTPMERNHVAYFSILHGIYKDHFSEKLNEKLKAGALSDVWKFIDKVGSEVLIRDIYGISITPVRADSRVLQGLKDLFA